MCDTQALDAAIRRFPYMLKVCKQHGPETGLSAAAFYRPAIVKEYHLILKGLTRGKANSRQA